MSNTPKPKKSQPEALPTDTGWRISDPGATHASLATRQFSLRGRCNFRGEIVHDGRAVRFESLLEYHTSLVLLADQRVANLVEQPSAIQYTAMDHCTHRHTFDFLVTLKDGRRIAVLVKPFRKANTIEFYDLIQRLKTRIAGRFCCRHLSGDRGQPLSSSCGRCVADTGRAFSCRPLCGCSDTERNPRPLR